MLTALCLLLALASPMQASAAGPAPVPTALRDQWTAMDPAALLDQAIERRALGDLVGARQRLEVLADTHALPVLATYHLAVTDELAEDWFLAQAGYDTLMKAWPDHPLARDAAFRRAIVLSDAGEHDDAARALRDLQRALRHDDATTDTDRQALELVRGAAELAAGHRRRGIQRVQRSLDALEGTDQLTWARSRARLALARTQLDEAARLDFPPKRADQRLVERAGLIKAAEQQVIAIAKLDEPEQALAGLLALGDAHLALHDDLIAAPPPKGLSVDQERIYGAMLADKAAVLQVKAWRYYDQGVALSTRLRWQGRIRDDLRARRDALDAQGLGPADAGDQDS